ncbi:MAG: bifunctional precorrin-2 dehydrogenase/sirohydrochlorin ferrochelatase [Candidatus Omnitrophica bacterium]|nr:bifunctional precorrin-2 dehydrogenase/sirohydrochlorin ferrochelatase [Candidatus Omnitrophota bacterium]
MRYYPLFADINEKKCCVIGGGSVALRKARALLDAGARVWVISPRLSEGLRRLKNRSRITHINARYQARFLSGASVVIAATDQRLVNARVSADARKARIPVNVVDVPRESTFIAPSYIARGDLVIAISTGGTAPALAKKIRRDLAAAAVPRYCRLLKKLARARTQFKGTVASAGTRKKLLEAIIRSGLRRRTS